MGASPSPKSGTFTYGCGCTRQFTEALPKVGDELTCRTHGPTYVAGTAPQWSAKCQEVGCKFLGEYGENGRLRSERGAALHRRRAKGNAHVVTVVKPNGEIHRVFDGAGVMTVSADF